MSKLVGWVVAIADGPHFMEWIGEVKRRPGTRKVLVGSVDNMCELEGGEGIA